MARILVGVLILFAILALPNDWGRLRAPATPSLPLEGLVAVGLLLVLPRLAARLLRAALVLALAALLFLKLADMGTGIAFSRPFNPILDLHFFVSGWHLLSGTVGTAPAIGSIAAALAVFAAAVAALAWGLGGLEDWRWRRRRRVGGLVLLLALAGLAVLRLAPDQPLSTWTSAEASRLAIERFAILERGFRDLAIFEDDLTHDPALAIPAAGFLQGLAGKDVVILFVESYGRSVIDDPKTASAISERFAAMEREWAPSGFTSRTGWLISPTVGGQSWLAHATLLSGLWVDGQQRYERLMVSDRPSLNRLFADAGWRTVGIMPAITMDWPEARWYAYDDLFVRDTLGYRGEPFNWVTMPDQFTLAALQRLALEPKPHAPVMAEVALISSHAPWTPIPRLLPWEAVGDGSIFNEQARSGDTPETVWRDPQRVREQYALSIDYALETIGSFIATYGTRDTVFLVLGDHQPASIVTGPDASREVPMHIISADPAIGEIFASWGWTEGLAPTPATPTLGMDRFRERLLQDFSSAPPRG